MKTRLPHNLISRTRSGSVLIIVLWVAFGLVSIALYFAHSMSMEMKAAENLVASAQAEQAIEGGALYVSNILATLQQPNIIPSSANFRAEAVKVGEGTFWLIGRDTNDLQTAPADQMVFGLVDEASKVNLNNATTNLFQNLPQMTANLAAAIYDWQSTGTTPSQGGAKSETYSLLQPPYLCKETNFETIDELRLVYGMDMDLLYGEDANLNGILDPNENDGDTLPPHDNQDGKLDPGLLEYVTVYTHEPTNNPDGTPRINVSSANSTALRQYLQQQIPGFVYRPPRTPPLSVLEFYVSSGMSEAQFMLVETNLYGANTNGLINVNTATETVLACIPGIGLDSAASVLSFRQSNPTRLNSMAWLKDALSLDANSARQVGPWVTGHSYQFSADIAAVGRHGRGYRRVKFVFDCSGNYPRIVYRQDLTHLGWALGQKVREELLAQETK